MDIDSADSRNPLAATEYVEELYKFYRENEVISCAFQVMLSILKLIHSSSGQKLNADIFPLDMNDQTL